MPAPSLASAVPVPLMMPEAVEAAPTLTVISPPAVARPPMVAAPVVVIFSAPPAVVIVSVAAPDIMKPPAPEVKDTEFAPVCARFRLLSVRSLMVILLVAANEMFVVAAIPSSSDSNNVVGVVSPERTVPVTPDGLPANELLRASASFPSPVPLAIIISAGSSSSIPVLPCGARVFTAPLNVKYSLPETSTKPPSPDCAPPRALMLPKKRVALSAQTITLPPLPLVMALALMLTPSPT